MSSVKRSNMAPSELGQPKAPDKWDSNSGTSTDLSTADSKTQQKSNNTEQQDSKEIKNLDDDQLKKLLDEAITYKKPSDREHKSQMFQNLLHRTELEDQARKSKPINYSSSYSCSDRSGSLQNLVCTGHIELSVDNKRSHHQHFRNKSNLSSVSSRQREGGSLPSNVNVTCSLSGSGNLTFLNEYKSITHENERSILNTAGSELSTNRQLGLDSVNLNIGRDDTNQFNDTKISHTVIEIGNAEPDHFLAHDSLALSLIEPSNEDVAIELGYMKKSRVTNMNFTSADSYEIGESSKHCYSIDKAVPFGAFLKSSIQSVEPVPLDSCAAVNSCIESKPMGGVNISGLQSNKFTYAHQAQNHTTPKQLDENGNSVQVFNASLQSTSQSLKTGKKRNKGDRNIKKFSAEEIEGNRGADKLEDLVAFIENEDISKKSNIINCNKNIFNSDRNNKKKNMAKKENSLKRSNSMEELKSSSKIDAENKSEQEKISLRQKQQQPQKRHTTDDIKDGLTKTNVQHSSPMQYPGNKRGERRSWGTEELNYLGEREAARFQEDDNKDLKKSKDNKTNNNNNNNMNNSNNGNNHNKNKSKLNDTVLAASSESIGANNDNEFRLVTSKKRIKKGHLSDEIIQKQQNTSTRETSNPSHSYSGNTKRNYHGNTGKYQPSYNYTNDRDIYLNSPTTAKNRRKSTSSMPPSDKSECSDTDYPSTHSLPDETTINRKTSSTTSIPNSSIISYADIARAKNTNVKYNNSTATSDKRPTVSSASSNNKNSDPPDNSNSNSSTCSNLSFKSQVSTRTNNKPPVGDCNDNNNSENSNKNKNNNDNNNINSDHNNNNRDKSNQQESCNSLHSTNNAKSTVSYSKKMADEKSPSVKHQSFDGNKHLLIATNSFDVQNSPQATADSSKGSLQKSRSVDSERYIDMGIDQYPALEKTIKHQKSHQNASPLAPNPGSKSTVTQKLSNKKTVAAVVAETVAAKEPKHMSKNQMVTKNTVNVVVAKQPEEQTIEENKLTFVQGNIKLDQLSNIDENFFMSNSNCTYNSNNSTNRVSSFTKKSKRSKSHQNSGMKNCNYGAHRPAVIIFNDNDTINENVSPLLFGDFNDEILQLIKRDDCNNNHIKNNVLASTSSNLQPTTTNPLNYNQNTTLNSSSENISKLSDSTLFTSPQSDPGYFSAHSRSTLTESFEVIEQQQQQQMQQQQQQQQQHLKLNENLLEMCTNKNTSDVVSNQLLNNLDDNKFSVQTKNESMQNKNHKKNKNKTNNNNNNDDNNNNNNMNNKNDNNNNKDNEIKLGNNIDATTRAALDNRKQVNTCNLKSDDNKNRRYDNYVDKSISVNVNCIDKGVNVNRINDTIKNNNNNNQVNVDNKQNRFEKPTMNHDNHKFSFIPDSNINTTDVICGQDVHVRFIDPPPSLSNAANFNHDKIVNFLGTEWDILIAKKNGNVHFYNGQ